MLNIHVELEVKMDDYSWTFQLRISNPPALSTPRRRKP